MFSHSVCHLFEDGDPVVVTDSPYACDLFKARGFRSVLLSSVITGDVAPPTSVILVSCEPENIPPRAVLVAKFSGSAVLIVPLLSFQADHEAVRYFSETVDKVDFKSACEANLKIVERLERTLEPIVAVSSDSDKMVVDLSLSLEIALPKVNARIAAGEWVSLGQFLELGLVPNEGHTAFKVNGSILCDGAAVAHHRHNVEQARPKAEMAWEILKKLQIDGRFPLRLTIVDSEVKSILTSDGFDILGQLVPLADEVWGPYLTEVAFASIEAIENPDWTVNSQLNEGAGGSHVAIGTGVHAAHIDFISSRASISIK